MIIAQQLYEGIDVGEGGRTGLITYMRTDSTQISIQAQKEARKYIQERHGADFLPATAPHYKTRAAGAQEAHEAIRPTVVFREPDRIKRCALPRPVPAVSVNLAAIRRISNGKCSV